MQAPQMMATSTTSPSDTTSPATVRDRDEENLQRKRARDRKSQRAMRERTKWNISCLTQQVNDLSRALEVETKEKADLYTRFLAVSEENDHLRVQKAALQLRLLGNGQGVDGTGSCTSPGTLKAHEAIPRNTAPTCLSDRILQTFVESRWEAYAFQPPEKIQVYPDKPDLSALFDGRPNRRVDETSAVVGDILRSYHEIDTLPKKVACHYVMSTLMKWQVLRTKQAYDQIPEWLRPIPCQLEKAHPSWVDRIPWPKVRLYLIEHPEIRFDDYASAYSSSFSIRWEYDPEHVIIVSSPSETASILINPIYEEHLRQLKNWTVGETFRRRFPEMAEIIDSYSKAENVPMT